MKTTALLGALAVSATMVAGTANAGNMEEPVMEPVVIVEDTSSSGGGYLIPVMFGLLLVAAIAANQ